jgi:hypothetical protein
MSLLHGFVFSRFFKESSDEEREHAEKLMKYQVVPLFVPVIIWYMPLDYS